MATRTCLRFDSWKFLQHCVTRSKKFNSLFASSKIYSALNFKTIVESARWRNFNCSFVKIIFHFCMMPLPHLNMVYMCKRHFHVFLKSTDIGSSNVLSSRFGFGREKAQGDRGETFRHPLSELERDMKYRHGRVEHACRYGFYDTHATHNASGSCAPLCINIFENFSRKIWEISWYGKAPCAPPSLGKSSSPRKGSRMRTQGDTAKDILDQMMFYRDNFSRIF